MQVEKNKNWEIKWLKLQGLEQNEEQWKGPNLAGIIQIELWKHKQSKMKREMKKLVKWNV